MFICGLNKTTLLDYPGHVAATVFLGGCNFRCPFCQNKDLLLHPADFAVFTEEDVLSHLKKRAGILTGVCITGGEPTLNSDLPDLIRKCKDLGYLVKLDTNGTNPEMLKMLYEEKLIDYVAMDIKSALFDYEKVAGIVSSSDNLLEKVKISIDFLMKETDPSRFDFEFRTTLVKGLHTSQSVSGIADLIAGAPHYFLQSYEESEGVLCPGFLSFSEEETNAFVSLIKDRIPSVKIRGVE